jgi:hypothetical protein
LCIFFIILFFQIYQRSIAGPIQKKNRSSISLLSFLFAFCSLWIRFGYALDSLWLRFVDLDSLCRFGFALSLCIRFIALDSLYRFDLLCRFDSLCRFFSLCHKANKSEKLSLLRIALPKNRKRNKANGEK